ncbi:hypothetical protein DICSQDRAFT_173153 [Dichomitus squalens LYAD-421 SS1]|uniref:Uncharacterized protein n=1 Tax=Dichomitus squalens (strain LYAD-421) TaxID=732165 RepID=R7SR40_DICSQ|nr:uncharacterized protein DICSQDRAFT_173153 [Dichomitus squalens LYAD-421 SS1]EJF58195.1 hypothetical protein DICSQDRAFT_173153 [Dichomitus squalens LYAD-421 SS1]
MRAAANGSFTATITNFNVYVSSVRSIVFHQPSTDSGVDGSRQETATINADGTGKNFVNAEVLQNGDKASGGAFKSKCLVSFITTGGFGNCVVVE